MVYAKFTNVRVTIHVATISVGQPPPAVRRSRVLPPRFRRASTPTLVTLGALALALGSSRPGRALLGQLALGAARRIGASTRAPALPSERPPGVS
jgi:hypothetical protein